MKRLIILLTILVALAATGCKEKRAATPPEKLVPTAYERKILRLHKLDPTTPAGQARLQKMRRNAERLEKSKARVRGWVEQAEQKKREEAERNKP